MAKEWTPEECLALEEPCKGECWARLACTGACVPTLQMSDQLTAVWPVLWAGYLCPLTANVFEVEFLEFRIREMEGQKRELYHVKKPDDAVPACSAYQPSCPVLHFSCVKLSNASAIWGLFTGCRQLLQAIAQSDWRAGLLTQSFVLSQPSEPIVDIPPELEDQYRLIQYSFPAEFLKARTIGTSLVFSVGDKEVRSILACFPTLSADVHI